MSQMLAAPGTGSDAAAATRVTRVFLLDDHEIVRRGLRELLDAESDLEIVGEAATAAAAPRVVAACVPDVAVLDVRLPDGDGIEVCRELRSAHPGLACLMLTSVSDDDAVYAAVMAGAAGYVLKQVRGADIVDSVRHVAAGGSLLDPSVTARLLHRLQHPLDDDDVRGLTSQERRILGLITEGLTNRQIGEQMGLAEKTIKNYVSNLFTKLGMTRRTEAAAFGARMAERQRR